MLSVPSAENVHRHAAYLASDEMEGRAPGSRGGQAAADYIRRQLDEAGLAPYFQTVRLRAHAWPDEAELILHGPDGDVRVPAERYTVTSETDASAIELRGTLVDSAPDVRGKIVVLSVPKTNDLLGTREYHLGTARERGARGVVILTESAPRTSWRDVLTPIDVVSPLQGIVELEASAFNGGAQELTLRARRTTRVVEAPNVVAVLEGADPRAGAIVVMAHYDAYGIGPDGIYNGGLDNASGTAALLELARVFAEREARLPRALVFVATTAEEGGTHGAKRYIDDPALPLAETALVLNIDGINVVGRTDDFIVFPSEGTDTAEALAAIGGRAGMSLARQSWQDGMHFAFDTRPFLKRGMVGLTLWQGSSYVEPPPRRSPVRIHTPSDDWPEHPNLEAIEQHLMLYVHAIEHFAKAETPALTKPNPFVVPESLDVAERP